ncbi:hypothetical protein, partial [Lysobacter sp. 1R34A]|uniref:hypothetical protein n=1 Tax=Lysobacter sp. 1R34A TaxID=3445786 RepID=UPI003EEAA2A6
TLIETAVFRAPTTLQTGWRAAHLTAMFQTVNTCPNRRFCASPPIDASAQRGRALCIHEQGLGSDFGKNE